ncbi:HAD-IIA family hydrolase [Luteipulveratus mongoliensis]|uniref:HAD-IIA family hydrolase n=1 Tax=Luteipulveratus mongoliensis TaxID=571913 RepID=UPI001FDFCDEA|nr:HAD-IIA family hydrolase [Luteipulveratus mongoliensis]
MSQPSLKLQDDTSLLDQFAGLICDLDGVVYEGPTAISEAIPSLREARDRGRGVVYATNNASRAPQEVADHLRSLGLDAMPDDVITSSVAGADALAHSFEPGSRVLAVGGQGVSHALAAAGLTPVPARLVRAGSAVDGESRASVVAVLQGYGPDVTAADLAEAAFAIHGGARWVATNTDRTLPTERGTAPGNGTLVAAVSAAVRSEPEVVGKPGPAMYELAARRLGAEPRRLLGIGDRLETDIAGAHAAGMPAMLVLTGVHGPEDLIVAERTTRPEYVGADLRTLHEIYRVPSLTDAGAVCGEATVRVGGADDSAVGGQPVSESAVLQVTGGSTDEQLRAALLLLWSLIDAGDLTPDTAVGLWRSSVG